MILEINIWSHLYANRICRKRHNKPIAFAYATEIRSALLFFFSYNSYYVAFSTPDLMDTDVKSGLALN